MHVPSQRVEIPVQARRLAVGLGGDVSAGALQPLSVEGSPDLLRGAAMEPRHLDRSDADPVQLGQGTVEIGFEIRLERVELDAKGDGMVSEERPG
jgi:hypothetical protein